MMQKFESKKSIFVIRDTTSKTINHLLADDLISAPDSLILHWDQSFRQTLKARDLMSTFSLLGSLVALLAVAVVILVLCLVLSVPFWIYIIYGFVGLTIIVTGFLIGRQFINRNREVPFEVIALYTIKKLIEWTKREISATSDLNNKRFLIENLLNAYFVYEHHSKSKEKALKCITEKIRNIVNTKEASQAAQISIRLYEIIFSDEKAIFDESGIMYLTKIFYPLLNLSADLKLSDHINQILKKFLVDTRINIGMCNYSVNKNSLPSKVRVTPGFFIEERLVLPFMEDLWRVPTEIVTKKKDFHHEEGNNVLTESQHGDEISKDHIYFENRITNVIESVRQISKKENKFDFNEHEQPESEFETDVNQHRNARPSRKSKVNSVLDKNQNPDDSQWLRSDQENFSRDLKASNPNTSKLHFRRTMTIKLSELGVKVSCFQSEDANQVIEELNIQKMAPAVSEPDPLISDLLALHFADTSNFVQLAQAPRIKISKHINEKPSLLAKSNFEINLSAHRVYQLLYNLNYRSQWDKHLSKFKIIKIIDEHTDLMYCYFKAPALVTDRDYIQKRVLAKNIQGADYVIGFISVEDPSVPVNKGIIRAHTFISGYMIFSTGDQTCKMTSVSQTDFKGNIPKAILNQAVQKGPIEWLQRLETASTTINDSF
jgi:hypothetical protein